MADNPTFQIPRDVIEPIIQAQVSAAVLSGRMAFYARLAGEFGVGRHTIRAIVSRHNWTHLEPASAHA